VHSKLISDTDGTAKPIPETLGVARLMFDTDGTAKLIAVTQAGPNSVSV